MSSAFEQLSDFIANFATVMFAVLISGLKSQTNSLCNATKNPDFPSPSWFHRQALHASIEQMRGGTNLTLNQTSSGTLLKIEQSFIIERNRTAVVDTSEGALFATIF